MFGLVPWKKEKDTDLALRNDPFTQMRREFDSLFDRVFGSLAVPGSGPNGWGLDVQDDGKTVVVRAEAPGFEAGEFEVQVVNDALYISAEHKEEGQAREGKEGQEGAQTRRWGRFERWVSLPSGTDLDKVEAHYKNGVLEVRLPRTPDAVGRKIEVKA